MKKRTIYCNIGWDAQTEKKTVWFGKVWGELKKKDSNASAIKTGKGLVVIDIDTKDFKEISKDVRKLLKGLKPTVETARGYHYYFEDKNSKQFINKAGYTKLLDVRSDGGIVFNKYSGGNKNISYEKVGDVHPKIPKKLRALLIQKMQIKRTRDNNRVQWAKVENGEIHDTTLSYAMKDFASGLSYDEVISNGLNYVERYLGNRPREITLMMSRIKWGYERRLDEKLEGVELSARRDDIEVGGEFEDDEILDMLVKAQKGGALELERVMKEIKTKLKISIATMKDMLKEAKDGGSSLSEFFKGEIVWDSNMGVYVEVRPKVVKYYAKQNFTQTVMSRSEWMSSSDVNEKLHTIPHKNVVYMPTKPYGDVIDGDGDTCVNVYNKVDYGTGDVKKIPKTINKILDNLFLDDPDAKEVFINWMATVIQTGYRTGVAWGFFGVSGSGKGFISDLMQSLVGLQNSSMNVSDTDLQSAFNPYAYNKSFVHLNEVASDFHGRHGVAGKLKALIGDPFLRINQKGVSEVGVDNFCNVILNSNEPNPIKLDRDDRRWNMITSTRSLSSLKWWKPNKSYKKAMAESMAFGRYLSQYEIDLVLATTPMTLSKAKASIIDQTTSSLQSIASAIRAGDSESIIDMLDDNDLIFNDKVIKNSCKTGNWGNNLLNHIYRWATGKKELKGLEVRKYFIAPYLTSSKSTVFKQKGELLRGYTLKTKGLK